MILRTPPAVNPPARLVMLAAGAIAPDARELRARSHFDPSALVEHRAARWEEGRWVGEVRINQQMHGRGIFRGTFAQVDSVNWCKALAPMADRLPADEIIDDDEWAAVVNAEFDAAPVDDAEFLAPEHIGARDAELGWPCDPTRHFAKLGEIEEYIVAWKETVALLACSGDAIENDHDFIRHGGA